MINDIILFPMRTLVVIGVNQYLYHIIEKKLRMILFCLKSPQVGIPDLEMKIERIGIPAASDYHLIITHIRILQTERAFDASDTHAGPNATEYFLVGSPTGNT